MSSKKKRRDRIYMEQLKARSRVRWQPKPVVVEPEPSDVALDTFLARIVGPIMKGVKDAVKEMNDNGEPVNNPFKLFTRALPKVFNKENGMELPAAANTKIKALTNGGKD